jgi:hypothetical protein
MDSEPVPSLELTAEHLLGLDLVGTVELPSPFPAAGRVFLVRHPGAEGSAAAPAQPRLFLKLVQRLSDSQTVTRFVSPEHVRGVRFRPSKPGEAPEEPTLVSGESIRREIGAIDWTKSVKDQRTAHEVELRPGHLGVLHVPESAPVLVRLEQTVPAALSLDALAGLRPSPCPHC